MSLMTKWRAAAGEWWQFVRGDDGSQRTGQADAAVGSTQWQLAAPRGNTTALLIHHARRLQTTGREFELYEF